MKFAHKIFGILFSVYFLNQSVAFIASFFGVTLYFLPGTVYFLLLTLYFGYMMLYSFNKSTRRVYPILFLVMIGIIWLLPQFMILYLFFLVTYTFMYQNGEPYAEPLSFVSIGHVVMLFIPIAGYLVVLYGWVRYAIKKPA